LPETRFVDHLPTESKPQAPTSTRVDEIPLAAVREPPSRWGGAALAALGLALATLALHGGALHGGWRFDDGPQLLFAASYSPWQYFSDAEVMRLQSYAHIAPWNAFFFELGLPLFGLWAAGHHAHLLAIVWLTAWATWWLLAQRLSSAVAWGGALLFLAMPPTGAVAHMLMTGHYAYGLLFSVLMLLAFSRAVQTSSAGWAFLAAGLYGLACLCKELYVPLVALPLMWPALERRYRWVLGAPLLLAALAYTLLRLHVLGGVGGYAALSGGTATLGVGVGALVDALVGGLARAGESLFGRGAAGAVALAIVVAGVVAAWWRGRRLAWPWLATCAVVVLTPILPLLAIAVPNGLERVMLLAGWSLAVLVAWQFEHWTVRRGRAQWRPLSVLAVLFALLLAGQRAALAEAMHSQEGMAAQNDFILSAGPTDALVATGFGAVGLLEAMREAVHRIGGRAAPVVVGDEEALLALGPDKGREAWEWQADCNCVRRLGEAYPRRVKAIIDAWAAGQGQALAVDLQLDDHGRAKVFRWQVSGAEGQLFLEVQGQMRLALPRQGALAFGTDATFRPTDPVAIRMTVSTPLQATVRSPWLSIPLSRSTRLQWQGHGTGPPPPG
jgi:hypothetical protein